MLIESIERSGISRMGVWLMSKEQDGYFISIAKIESLQSTCLRRKVGAIIVSGPIILTSGHNGAPDGHPNCYDSLECFRVSNNIPSGESLHLCKAVHAEARAITNAAKYGISINGATLYVNVLPCTDCAKLIISAGIDRVVFSEFYPHLHSSEMFRLSRIELVHFGEDD